MSTRRLNITLPGLPKIGLYVSLLLLPGGFIGLLLVCWMEHRKAQGKARMWYSQLRGWRDVVPGIWSLLTARPRLDPEPVRLPVNRSVTRCTSNRLDRCARCGETATSCAAAS